MTDAVLALSIYYSVAILAGMTLFVLGFKLFQQGIVQAPMRVGAGAGLDTAAASGTQPAMSTITPKYTLQLENLAPGTAYALMGTILVGIGLFKGPPALTDAATKQNEREVKVAEVSRDRAYAEARIAPRFDSTGGAAPPTASATSAGPRPTDGGTSGQAFVVQATPIQLGFPPGVTLKTQMESIQDQIKALTKQNTELDNLSSAIKKLGESKELNKEESDVLTGWLLYQRLPSGPITHRPTTQTPKN